MTGTPDFQGHSDMPERIKSIEDRLTDLRADLRERDKIQTDRYHALRNDAASVKLLVDRMERHNERLAKLEAEVENMNVKVLADRVDRLTDMVVWLMRTGVALMVSIIVGIVVILATHY